MRQQPDFSPIPASARERVRLQWLDFERVADVASLPPTVIASLPRVWANSAFVTRSCLANGELLVDLVRDGKLERACAEADYQRALAGTLDGVASEAELARLLRRFRQRELVRIAWRDLSGWASLDETLSELSALAQVIVGAAVEFLHETLRLRYGQPRDATGAAVGFTVLGMGKLGGGELNFSSDIDLIFAYSGAGRTDGERALDNDDYFRRLARRLIRVLDEPTEDGFVYRVDTRLRPFGDSGPLVMSFGAMEDYYQFHGRDWERYALIKARPVAGDCSAGHRLLRMLRPFIYRRYLDYNTFEALRGMKRLIEQQVARKGLEQNIKLGAGGIREVEFIAQAFQLVRAGHEPRLQNCALRPVLALLGEFDLLPPHVVSGLRAAYEFLRRVENRLQEVNDQQTHDLPRGDEARALLAWSLGFAHWPAFAATLAEHRRRVHQHFEAVFAVPQVEDADEDAETRELAALWHLEVADEQAQEVLAGLGIDDAVSAMAAVRGLRESARYRGLGEQGRRRLGQLMPLLLKAVAGTRDAAVVLTRVLAVIEAIASRVTYIALLVENPMALSQLVKLCAASPWISHQLARHPILLDDLLDPRSHLHHPPDRSELEAILASHMRKVEPGDREREMDELRRFKQTSTLRVAAAEVSGSLRLRAVSEHLTEIAEVLLEEALRMARSQVVERHGRPLITDSDTEAPFAVIAYGKLGGFEMSYASDLDLVFLHGGDSAQQMFFVRLAQRVIHLLSTQTSAGSLYEVDMRLRPSGRAGLLVSGLDAFRRYQSENAWTWEHQALVRARPVAGDAGLGRCFAQVREGILRRGRDVDELRAAVRDMRARMRASQAARAAGRFDLKQGEGGITDIEFMCQYAVLRWAPTHETLAHYTDNVHILGELRTAGLIDAGVEELLVGAYRAYRARLHALALQEMPALAEDSEFREYRAGVARLWRQWME